MISLKIVVNIKSQINANIVVVVEFNNWNIIVLYKRETLELNVIIDQVDLRDLYILPLPKLQRTYSSHELIGLF